MRPTREAIRTNQYAYFVSTQTEGRKPFFRNERWAQLMVATLAHYGESAYILHAFVVMPDHLHVLISPQDAIEKSVQMIKGGFSFRAKRDFHWIGAIWQEGFTDHRIRDEEDWERHLEYIRMNPVRAQLAEDSGLYPYVGFPDRVFPQGLKPSNSSSPDVRAEARTLQTAEARTLQAAEAVPFQARERLIENLKVSTR